LTASPNLNKKSRKKSSDKIKKNITIFGQENKNDSVRLIQSKVDLIMINKRDFREKKGREKINISTESIEMNLKKRKREMLLK